MKVTKCLVVIAIVTVIATGIISVVGRSNTRGQGLPAKHENPY